MSKFFTILFFIAVVVIEFLATTTTVHIEIVETMWDKANHFVAFITLYILLSFSHFRFNILQRGFLLFAFGLQIEIVQYFIDGRDFSLLDLFADSIAIVLGVVLLKLYEKLFFKV